jgi:hypothetical protein
VILAIISGFKSVKFRKGYDIDVSNETEKDDKGDRKN